nr:NPF transporter [Taxus x media]
MENSNQSLTVISSIPKRAHDSELSADKEQKDLEEHTTVNVQEKKKKAEGWKTFPFIIGNEVCSYAAATGMLANIIVYLTTQFNIKNIEAVNIMYICNGGSQLAPLVGGLLADTYLGRFWTIAIGSVLSFLAMVILTLTAVISSLRPPACSPKLQVEVCHGPSTAQYAVLYIYFALSIVGSGGVSFISSAFGADQFDKESADGMKKIQAFFNWYYFGLYSAVIVATTVIVYIQANVSWALGFGICAVLTGMSMLFFFCGTKLYNRIRPQGSPFTGLAQVVVACVRKRHLQLSSNPDDYYHGKITESGSLPLSQELRVLNKAAIKISEEFPSEGEKNPNSWRLCSVEKVEDLKSILKTLPILSALIIPSIMIYTESTFVVLQALIMDRHLGPHFQIPAASFVVFILLSSIIVLPIYDRVIVPIAAGKGIKFTCLQRIGMGMIIYCVGLGVAAIVERKRLNVEKSASMVPMSALWLIPQNAILGLAVPFQSVGSIDFFYSEFPETVRSTAIGLISAATAAGLYSSSLLVRIVHKNSDLLTDDLNHSRLDWFYGLVCGMGVLNFGYFIAWARWYKYKTKVYGEQNISTP